MLLPRFTSPHKFYIIALALVCIDLGLEHSHVSKQRLFVLAQAQARVTPSTYIDKRHVSSLLSPLNVERCVDAFSETRVCFVDSLSVVWYGISSVIAPRFVLRKTC